MDPTMDSISMEVSEEDAIHDPYPHRQLSCFNLMARPFSHDSPGAGLAGQSDGNPITDVEYAGDDDNGTPMIVAKTRILSIMQMTTEMDLWMRTWWTSIRFAGHRRDTFGYMIRILRKYGRSIWRINALLLVELTLCNTPG